MKDLDTVALRATLRSAVALACAALACTACSSTSKSFSASSARPLRASTQTSTPPTPMLAGNCFASLNKDCVPAPGTYVLGQATVIPGMRITIPAGWTSSEEDFGEFNLHPASTPDDSIFFWADMSAVKSTGPGHGTTVLNNVDRTAAALTHYLVTNPALAVVGSPAQVQLGGVSTTRLVWGVARTARYGDPQCPANPRCADVFTNTRWWNGNSFGIGAPSQDQTYLAETSLGSVIVDLDADNPTALAALEKLATPILESLSIPT